MGQFKPYNCQRYILDVHCLPGVALAAEAPHGAARKGARAGAGGEGGGEKEEEEEEVRGSLRDLDPSLKAPPSFQIFSKT